MEFEKRYGYNIHRLKSEDDYYSKEVAFAEAINKELKYSPDMLAQIVGNPERKTWLTEDEEKAVLSTIQWLGTPVGQGFLEKVNRELTDKEIKLLNKPETHTDYFATDL
jgi:hypothetical protein